MPSPPQRERLAELLESVVAGQISAGEALAETASWPSVLWQERLFDHAWHVLSHYQQDADIRESDASYAKGSRSGLLRYAKRLRRPSRLGILDWLGWRRAGK